MGTARLTGRCRVASLTRDSSEHGLRHPDTVAERARRVAAESRGSAQPLKAATARARLTGRCRAASFTRDSSGYSSLLRNVKIGSSGGQNSRARIATVPMPRDTYSGASVSRYHPAMNRPLPYGVYGV